MATKRTAESAERSSEPERIYTLRVELRDIAPAIWRRLLVPGWITLATLHQALQRAMGWNDRHLHQFHIDGKQYGIPDDDWPEPLPLDERRFTLMTSVGSGVTKFSYEYDFGDAWQHSIQVENIASAQGATSSLLCTAGANACPPDDVGGPPGYFDFIQAISDPSHPEHAEMLHWCGGAFDPTRFDLDAANAALRRVKLPSKR